MRRVGPILLGFLALLTLLAPLAPTASAARPLFYEAVLVAGDAHDYAGNGALDISDVYVAEVAPYILEHDAMQDQVILRIEPRALSDLNQCMVQTPKGSVLVCQVRYEAHFRAAGRDHMLYAIVQPPLNYTEANTAVAINDTSVKFLLDRARLGLLPGTTIERLYVTTQLLVAGAARAADRAPGDNQNQPYDQRPELEAVFAPVHRLNGTYPFFRVELLTPETLHSRDGSPVEFRLKITSSPLVEDDSIYVRWDTNWSVIPSRGATGLNPYGLLTGLRPASVSLFDFTASPRDLVERGEVYPLPTRLHSSSQGHIRLPLAVKVTGASYEDPGYVFQILASSPLRAGTPATFTIGLTDASGLPRPGLPIEVLFRHAGRLVATVPAAPDGSHYRVSYTFPRSGTWTVEPQLARTEPAPHGLFTVTVEGKGSPAPGLAPFALAAALVLLRRARLGPPGHNGF